MKVKQGIKGNTLTNAGSTVAYSLWNIYTHLDGSEEGSPETENFFSGMALKEFEADTKKGFSNKARRVSNPCTGEQM